MNIVGGLASTVAVKEKVSIIFGFRALALGFRTLVNIISGLADIVTIHVAMLSNR